MKKAVNYMRGNVCVQVECPYPERFVNVCAQNNIEFWRLVRVSPICVTVYMHIGGYRRLRTLAGVAGFAVKLVKKTGIPFFLWRLRKRYVLIAGMSVCFLALRILSLFVWELEVHGNEKVPARLILEALEELDVGIGTFGPSISSELLANEVILRIPELSWLAVNVKGSHADVLVRERIPKPEIVDEKTPAMVYAEKSGIIVKMSVLEGASKVSVGDTIEKGDILVTGIMDSIASGRRAVHAMAEIYARTWYEMSAQMPLEAVIKEYTGREKKKTSIIIAGKKINLFISARIPWQYYDKISKENVLTLPTGNRLPVAVASESYREYDPLQSALSVSDADKILRERLLESLEKEIKDGTVVSTEFETVSENGIVTVTLKAECVEEIAAERGFSEAELLEAYTGGEQSVEEELPAHE